MKRALVTGGSGAIGTAIAHALARDGLQVVVHANRQLDQAKAVAAAIMAEGGQASAVSFDVTDADATRAALVGLLTDGAIQVLVNNAGIHDDAIMPGMRHDQWTRVIDVSLNGFFNVTQPLLMPMIGKRWGRIVNVSSIAGVVGNRGQTNYAATKFGVIGFTKTWARELGPKGIRVNAVCPGFIATEMVKAMPENILKDIEKRSWLGRLGTPEEMANVYLFLASDEASYVNGVALEASGGISL